MSDWTLEATGSTNALKGTPHYKDTSKSPSHTLYERFDPLNSVKSPFKVNTNRNGSLMDSSDNKSLYLGSSSVSPTKQRHPAARALSRKSGLSASTERLSSAYSNSITNNNHIKDIDRTSSNNYSMGMARDTLHSKMHFNQEEKGHIANDYVKQLHDLKVEYQTKILAKDREWDKKYQVCRQELMNTQDTANKLQLKCMQMTVTCADYEKTMNDLLDSKSHVGAPEVVISELRSERDQYAEDLQHVESSFTDLHKRFDRLRVTANGLKKNDEKLREEIADKNRQLRESSEQFQKLKEQTQAKLTLAAEQVERAKSESKAELIRLQMALKKAELHSQGLEQQLKQKVAENNELTKICDNLISLKGGEN